MQTFLPFPDYIKSAQSLDKRRLNKQIVEAYQILLAIHKKAGLVPYEKKGWFNHPAVIMWQGAEDDLLRYFYSCEAVWQVRHKAKEHKSLRDKIVSLKIINSDLVVQSRNKQPSWLGDSSFHLSHQSNLVRKDSAFYSPQFPSVSPNLPYLWPKNVSPV